MREPSPVLQHSLCTNLPFEIQVEFIVKKGPEKGKKVLQLYENTLTKQYGDLLDDKPVRLSCRAIVDTLMHQPFQPQHASSVSVGVGVSSEQ